MTTRLLFIESHCRRNDNWPFWAITKSINFDTFRLFQHVFHWVMEMEIWKSLWYGVPKSIAAEPKTTAVIMFMQVSIEHGVRGVYYNCAARITSWKLLFINILLFLLLPVAVYCMTYCTIKFYCTQSLFILVSHNMFLVPHNNSNTFIFVRSRLATLTCNEHAAMKVYKIYSTWCINNNNKRNYSQFSY